MNAGGGDPSPGRDARRGAGPARRRHARGRDRAGAARTVRRRVTAEVEEAFGRLEAAFGDLDEPR
jgi:hypothetical protein